MFQTPKEESYSNSRRSTNASYTQTQVLFSFFPFFEDIDECKRVLCNTVGERCLNSIGSFGCECIEGYSRNPDNTCTNINECELEDVCLGDHETCEDFDGGYSCECEPGYQNTIAGGESEACYGEFHKPLNTMFNHHIDRYRLFCFNFCRLDLFLRGSYIHFSSVLN